LKLAVLELAVESVIDGMSAVIRGSGWLSDSDTIAAHRHDGSVFQCLAVARQDVQRQLNSTIGWHVWQTQQTAVRKTCLKNQLTEIGVDGHQRSLVLERLLQQRPVSGVRADFSRLDDVMTVLTQGDGQSMSRAPVDEKSHVRATSTSSNDS
jgi:hypothetical protein